MVNGYPPPPINSHECQKKGLTEKAFRNSLILKAAILLVQRGQALSEPHKEKKRHQGCRSLNMDFPKKNCTREIRKVKENLKSGQRDTCNPLQMFGF